MLEIFHRRGFDLLVAEASVRSAEGDLIAAGAIANPLVSGGAGRNFDCGPSQDCSATSFSVGLSDENAISVLVTGKRSLRKEVARAALQAARGNRDDARRTLDFQVKQAWFQVLVSDALVKAAVDTRDSNLRTQELNERRFERGAIHEGDLAKAQVAALESEQALDQARQSLRSAKVALGFLLGFRELVPDFPVDTKELDFVIPPELANATRESLLKDALSRRPDLRGQKSQEARAKSALSLARRNVVPDFTLSATYSANGAGDTNISPPNATVGLSFPIPLFYLQRGEILKAESDLATQQVLVEKAEAQVVTDVEAAFAQFVSARLLVERMEKSLLDRAKKARDIAQNPVREGLCIPPRSPRCPAHVHRNPHRVRAGPRVVLERGRPNGRGGGEGDASVKHSTHWVLPALLGCLFGCHSGGQEVSRAPEDNLDPPRGSGGREGSNSGGANAQSAPGDRGGGADRLR